MNLRGVAASVVDNQLLIEDVSSPERPLKKVSSSMTYTSLVASLIPRLEANFAGRTIDNYY